VKREAMRLRLETMAAVLASGTVAREPCAAACWCAWLCVAWLAGGSSALAQSEASTDPLPAYFRAFAAKHLLSTESADVSELRRLLAEAEQLAQDGRHEDAALLFFDLTRHPRFAAYAELEEFSAAHYGLGNSLAVLGAAPSARRALRYVLDKGPADRYFAPAYRRYVDVALAVGPLTAALEELAPYDARLPDALKSEPAYLRARERQLAGDRDKAASEYERIDTRSRFYANAQYQLGALAAEQRAFDQAEKRFCRIAGPGEDRRYPFFVDGRYFRVKDLARLGLGRVAHEMRRGDDAFYYYFQVPNDSPRLSEAMFEAAYARYEAEDAEGASDLLDQLEARFPRSPYADEAALLRGYVALAGCDYEAASRHFTRFDARFTPLLAYIDRLFANPVRRAVLYDALRDAEPNHARAAYGSEQRTLFALLRVDPEFVALHERLSQLDQEAARAGQLPESFALLAARYLGTDRPRPLADPQLEAASALRLQLTDARSGLSALGEQLDTLRALRVPASELAPFEGEIARLGARQRALESRLSAALHPGASDAATGLNRQATTSANGDAPNPAKGGAATSRGGGAAAASDPALAFLLADAARAAAARELVLDLRPAMVRAANMRALTELRALRARLGGFLRRARIGRVDAIMGSKRRIEHQIEELAAGRYLQDSLHVQGFLADDEEYWPFEGDDWPDEYLETNAPARRQPPARRTPKAER
jgi:TolA-binding protein